MTIFKSKKTFIVTIILTAKFCLLAQQDPVLFIPGPVMTSPEVKQAMLHDYSPADSQFQEITQNIRDRLLRLVNGEATHTVIPQHGSGTFAVEAMLETLIAPHNNLLVLRNGCFGELMTKICNAIAIKYTVLEFDEDKPIDPEKVRIFLSNHPEISHIAMVYCETGTGIINPIEQIAQIAHQTKRKFLVDAVSAFGILPLDCAKIPFDAVATSSNKGLQSLPGCSFCIIRKSTLQETKNNARTFALDLYEQWDSLEKAGLWRYTPPVPIILAVEKALDELEREGGFKGRYKRYKTNFKRLVKGMHRLGFPLYIPEENNAPVVATFLKTNHPNFDMNHFYQQMKKHGFMMFPGKLTKADSFRIGCIGTLTENQIDEALNTIETIVHEYR